MNNINEGRGLISFLLADYTNLLKRESGIKRGHLILFSNPGDKIRKLLTTRREGEIRARLSNILRYLSSCTWSDERIIIQEEVMIIKKTNKLQGLDSRGGEKKT